jgi:RNA polymerase sigma factor (sigma-70 family)
MPRSAAALCRIAATSAPATTPDAQLLRAYTDSRGDDAFAELVRRHGPMVLAACRRILSDTHDAEDAFQATFLVLARKAGSIRGTNIAGYLYAVAIRTARGVRLMRDRRRKREQIASTSVGQQSVPFTTDDTAAVIDEELANLPAHLRDAVVLCELRGLSRREAATELDIAEGTLSSRLASAKRKLAARLSARGLAGAAALAPALAPAAVSAALVEVTAVAVRGAAGGVASAAASTVLKGMLFDQLRATVLVGAVLIAGVCGGLAMTGAPGAPPDKAVAPAPRAVIDPGAKWVEQLGSTDFNEREAAQKELRKLGLRAEAALKAGLKSEDPEIRARCATLLTEIRKDALAALVKDFDPAADNQPDHPIWNRFKGLVGDTLASRDLFARVVKRPEWLRRLAVAETGPEAAAQQYRDACAAVGQQYRSQMMMSGINLWFPCDHADEAVYLLFLGSYAGTEDARPKADADARTFVEGEERLYYARGLTLGLQGKEFTGRKVPPEGDAIKGTDRCFSKLFGAWLLRRTDDGVLYCGFELAVSYRAVDVLPAARLIAADMKRPVGERCAALRAVAQFGARTDLPLFAALYDDSTGVILRPPPSSFNPGPRSRRFQVRDHAVALALLLCGQDPFEYGFTYTKDRFRRVGGRPDIANYEAEAFGASDDDTRTAAHAKAKAFLARQKDAPKEPKPEPTAAKLVERLGSAGFAEREAAQKELRKLGLRAETALKAGLKSESQEVRDRCAALLTEIRKSARDALAKTFDPDSDTEPDHPIWERFQSIAGRDKHARKLFAELISDPRRLKLLDDADREPNSVGKLYAAALDEYYATVAPRLGLPPAKPLPERPWADELLIHYLGTYTQTIGTVPKTNLECHTFRSWEQALASPAGPAVRRVFAAWYVHRDNDYAIRSGFQRIADDQITEALPFLRKLIADEKADPERRAQAALLIGLIGAQEDLSLLRRVAESKSAEKPHAKWSVILKGKEHLDRMWNTIRFGGEVTQEEQAEALKKVEWAGGDRSVADCAWAAAVLLVGEKPHEFGFLHPQILSGGKGQRDRFQYLYWHGFPDEKARAAAHAKAQKFLDKPK